MNDLGPKELEFLSALKQSDEPEFADRERVRRRVWLAVGLAAVGTSGVGVGTQTAVAATPKVGLFALTTAKVGIVVGLATGGAVLVTQPWATQQTTSVSQLGNVRQVAESEQIQAAVAEAAPVEPQSVISPVVVTEPAEAPVVSSRSRGKSQPASQAPLSADLDAEIQLLRQARQAMQAGDFSQALDSLGEHAHRFPKGVLASERQASTAIALCRSGEMATGKARATHYLRRNPTSPLADRVRTSCKIE